MMGGELRRQEEIAEAATLNEPTKKAIVTEMSPEELATPLIFHANKYATHAQMKWQVVNYVNLKLLWVDHVQLGADGEDVDYFGGTTKGKGKSKGQSLVRPLSGGTHTVARSRALCPLREVLFPPQLTTLTFQTLR